VFCFQKDEGYEIKMEVIDLIKVAARDFKRGTKTGKEAETSLAEPKFK